MKLIAVQQESVVISRGLPQSFVMMDRVPVFLEIDAANMPYPCKIVMRPVARIYSEEEANFVAKNMVVYVSSQTKNPAERNYQLKL
jgi:hypothetical protein